MKIGYARVSTQDQNLDMQMDALKASGCERIYTEKMSGKRDDRPELQRCLDALRNGDTLVVYKLDRLGRSTFKLLELTAELEKRGVEFVSIRDNIDTSTAVGKAMFRMMAVLAEMERDIIAERTQAGLQAARARGRVGGRPKTDKTKIATALALYDAGDLTVPEIVEATDVSKATLYRAINNRKDSVSK
ncbi:recombinase family protein [Aneurinibacillus sp. REN35]|uniref:recombinase family protein n=1 Tax=Aneurinibacillus sp. REN35 TaxID=3237286 RepID=UPI0035274A48